MAGLALLSLDDGFDPEAGQFFFLLAALVLAFYFTLNSRAANANPAGRQSHRAAVPVYPLTTLALLTVGLVTLVLSFSLEPWEPTFSDFGSNLVLWIVLSAIVGTAARFFCAGTWGPEPVGPQSRRGNPVHGAHLGRALCRWLVRGNHGAPAVRRLRHHLHRTADQPLADRSLAAQEHPPTLAIAAPDFIEAPITAAGGAIEPVTDRALFIIVLVVFFRRVKGFASRMGVTMA